MTFIWADKRFIRSQITGAASSVSKFPFGRRPVSSLRYPRPQPGLSWGRAKLPGCGSLFFLAFKVPVLTPQWGGRKWRRMALWGKEWRGARDLLVLSLDCFLSITPCVWMVGTFYLEGNYFCAQLSVLPGKLWLPYKRGLPVFLCPRSGRPPGQ